MKKLIKKDFLIPLFILLFFIHANFISAFGFEFQIQTTSPNENFNWGIYDASNITVNWGDSASNETLNGSYVFANHSYSVADTYNISLIGNATRISFYNGTEDSLINILTPISNGLDGITSGYEMFRDAKNITNFTTENFFDETSSNVTNMWSMFRDATNFNGNISNWNTSSVVEMGNMFYGATSFNGNISNWDVSNVNNMYSMFRGLTFFNQDLTTWDTSNLEGVDAMFYNVTNFNGNISNWNISKISDTWYMFAYAISFNQNLTNWDTSKVINMDHMFYNATSFNGNISNWNTSSVTDMNNMFYNATSFNQDLSNWDVSSVTNYNWTITDGGLYFSGEETPVPSSSGGGGGSGGGGSTIPTIIFSKEQFEKGYSANLAVGSRFEVNVENNLVNLTLKYIHEEIFNKEILNNQSSVEEGNISGEERLYEEGKKIRISFGFYFIFAVILIIGIVLLIKFKKFKKWKKQK